VKTRVANCPSCGGPVEFRSRSSLVTVCDFCQTVVARGDKEVEDHGKVADLALTDSPLKRGVTGKFRGKPFELVGRVQYKHPAGGVWDEWYLSFSSGKWGWLAEAQGKYYLTFENKASSKLDLPAMDSLEPGQRFKLGSIGEITVAEVGVAETGAAEGEIPWDFRPGIPHPFADLHGQDKQFVTFDYSGERPRLFIGAEVELDDLELSGVGWEGMGVPGIAGGGAEEKVEALNVNCPQCGGPLKLQLPDETERVTCPNCSSLLDCTQGKLEYFQTIRTRAVKPVIPLGSKGTLFGDEYTVIGFMERFVRYEGMNYPWTEYLLHNPDVGFRWLVRSQKHWSFVEPLSPSEVTLSYGSAVYDDDHFAIYDRGEATVRYVLGEFYWKVHVGEKAETADYIAPPRMISSEKSESAGSKELNISLGTYLTVDEVEEAFDAENIARPWGVGVIQPKPQFMGDIVKLWGIFALVMFFLYSTCKSLMTATKVDGEFLFWMLVAVSIVPIGSFFYMHNFEVQRWADSDYSPYATEDDY
jgi:hypothetical protein